MSPFQAISWEYWRRLRGSLAWGIPAMLLLPLWLYSFLRMYKVPLEEQLRIAPRLALGTLVTILIPTLGLVGSALGDPRRFYVLPISKRELVAARMLLGSVTTGIIVFLVLSIANLAAGAGLPAVNAAAFIATTGLIVDWGVWRFRDRQAFQGLGCGLLGLACLFALGFRVRDWQLLQAETFWKELSGGELLVLLLILGAVFMLLTTTIHHDRHGIVRTHPAGGPQTQTADSAAIVNASETRRLSQRRMFAGPFTAQVWCEWRQTAWLLPMAMLVVQGLFSVLFLASKSDAANAVAFRARFVRELPIILSTIGGLAFVFPPWIAFLYQPLASSAVPGRPGPLPLSLATKPFTSAQIALASLASLSLAILSGMAAGVLGAVSNLLAFRVTVGPDLWTLVREWADLQHSQYDLRVMCWVTVLGVVCGWGWSGVNLALVQSGRRFLPWLGIGIPTAFVLGTLVVGQWAAPFSPGRGLVVIGSLWMFSLLLAPGTLLVFVAALVRRAISWKITLAAVCLYGGLLFAWYGPLTFFSSPLGDPRASVREVLPMLPLLLSVVIAPLAATPLAVQWNRHR